MPCLPFNEVDSSAHATQDQTLRVLVTVNQEKVLLQPSSRMPHLLVGLCLCLNGLLVRLQPVQQRIHLLLSLDVGILLLCSQLSFQSLDITCQSVTQLL